MDDLISRRALCEYALNQKDKSVTPNDIMRFPSAQPEIVQCKDCKYQNKGSNESDSWNLCGFRPWLYVPTDDEHYCGYAERRKDG